MSDIAHYHLPGLFEFYEFYKAFLPIYRDYPEYFYDWCDISSIYGAPADCLWGGGRVGFGEALETDVLKLMNEYGISSRFTFSNSLITEEHLKDSRCNRLLKLWDNPDNGIIITSDILLDYIKKNYPNYYLVSSTTKVITSFSGLNRELNREEFSFVVPDFRLNNHFNELSTLPHKNKIEFLCNECCWTDCYARKDCYENVSHKALGHLVPDHVCVSPNASSGYRFSDAMKSPSFIGVNDITTTYLPMGYSNFKIEGRSLGSALLLEFILYYMVKPEYQLIIREMLYLDSSLDLF